MVDTPAEAVIKRRIIQRLRDQRIVNDFDMRLEAALDIQALVKWINDSDARVTEALKSLLVLKASTRYVPYELVTQAIAALTGTTETSQKHPA